MGGTIVSRRIVLITATVIHFFICCGSQTVELARGGPPRAAHPVAQEACAEFDEVVPLRSGWLLKDCVDVWTAWASTLRQGDRIRYADREIFTEIAVEQRRRGSPCVVKSGMYNDGVGSSSIRDFATWVFAEEMGCDWVQGPVPQKNNGTSLYCHTTTANSHFKNIERGQLPNESGARCSLNNWFGFFTYDAHVSKLKLDELKLNGRIENVQVRYRRQPMGHSRLCSFLLVLSSQELLSSF